MPVPSWTRSPNSPQLETGTTACPSPWAASVVTSISSTTFLQGFHWTPNLANSSLRNLSSQDDQVLVRMGSNQNSHSLLLAGAQTGPITLEDGRNIYSTCLCSQVPTWTVRHYLECSQQYYAQRSCISPFCCWTNHQLSATCHLMGLEVRNGSAGPHSVWRF